MSFHLSMPNFLVKYRIKAMANNLLLVINDKMTYILRLNRYEKL